MAGRGGRSCRITWPARTIRRLGVLPASACSTPRLERHAAAGEICNYAHELAPRRRARPGDDIVSRLLLPDIALDGQVSPLRSNFRNGIEHLPVRITA
ncbi:MAG TPA: hypothetical protein VFQ44_05690 [Streptosporangiaceae bacterium]|nr:hypothetical protein [Streptosporangiaceae bacterium]